MKSVLYGGFHVGSEMAEALFKHELTMPILPDLLELVATNFGGGSLYIVCLFVGSRLESIHIKWLNIDFATVKCMFLAASSLTLGRVELESLKVSFCMAHISTRSKRRHLQVYLIRAGHIGSISGSGLTHIIDLQLGGADATTFDQFLSLCQLSQSNSCHSTF
jgi:hypothetical protein